jgi:nucleotide-binding universal stress UspA family protein
MTYATVMVSLALDQPNRPRLDIACQLAERSDARLIGVAAAEFSPPVYYTSGAEAELQLDQGLAAIKARLAELENEFFTAAHGRVKAVGWRSALEFPAKYIARQSRAADIVVAGADSGGPFFDPFVSAHPSDLVMQTGRPLLIVPEGAGELDLRNILIAWKDRPEARRAMTAALPALRKADEVTVVEIVEPDASRTEAEAAVEDVVQWLSQHGIAATSIVPDSDGHAVKQIETLAAELGATLIVAGAYGHSRFREWVLGGVTRHLIAHPSRCALLSH